MPDLLLKEFDVNKQRIPLAQRFWGKVRVGWGDACWEWTGCLNGNGYGNVRVQRTEKQPKAFLAHRVAFMLTYGRIPDGLYVLHKCDQPSCVKPEHLWLGTQQDNVADCTEKRRHTHGERNRHAKLTAAKVRSMRSMYAQGGESHATLARKFNMDRSTVGTILIRKNWRFV